MVNRVFARIVGLSLVLAALSTSVVAQTFSPPAAAPAEITLAAEQVTSLLKEGETLELSGRWADALSHYEEALRQHPNDKNLAGRFDLARLHYSLEQRYDDRSFRNSVATLRTRESVDLYSDMLSKIGAHYYTDPPWQDLSSRGLRAMDIALADQAFLTTNRISAGNRQVEQLRGELDQLSKRYMIRSRSDAVAVASQAAQLARRQINLSETATLLEFTAAAAGGLDHYSAFLTADQLRDIYSQIEGNFVGLGVELKADNGALLIVHVIPGSPAKKAGILDDDRIVAVDGKSTATLSTDEAAALLTGPEGSTCRVTVVTSGQAPRDLAIRRAHVEVPSLEDIKIINAEFGVAYIRIPAFQKTTSRDLEAALWDLHRQGMRSLVLDLRGNPGGLLTASVEVADMFVAEGAIVSTRGRSEQENFNYRAQRPGTWRVPLVVLIDGDSASASEIFAAAIQDARRGVVIGARSYGKGSVQGIFPLGYAGAGARITTAKFYSPLGHPISNVGITPDIDARRATAVAQGEQSAAGALAAAGESVREVAYRGLNNAPATTAPAASAPASSDATLDLAVEVARNQPVAQL